MKVNARTQSLLSLNIFYYFMCLSVLLVCMCVPGVCGSQKKVSNTLGLELQVIVRFWELNLGCLQSNKCF